MIFSLVSAFEDKFMHLNKYYKKAVADPIKAKYGEVSFKTFVQYILDDKGCRMMTKCSLDTHWLPFYINCGYCSLKYKYFVRAEHFNTDTKYIGYLTKGPTGQNRLSNFWLVFWNIFLKLLKYVLLERTPETKLSS